MYDNGSETGWGGYEDRNRNVGHSDGMDRKKKWEMVTTMVMTLETS